MTPNTAPELKELIPTTIKEYSETDKEKIEILREQEYIKSINTIDKNTTQEKFMLTLITYMKKLSIRKLEQIRLLAISHQQYRDILENKKIKLKSDQINRAQIITKILKARIMFQGMEYTQSWLRNPHKYLLNKSPIEYMLENNLLGIDYVYKMIIENKENHPFSSYQERVIYAEKVKKDPSLKIPPTSEAEKIEYAEIDRKIQERFSQHLSNEGSDHS